MPAVWPGTLPFFIAVGQARQTGPTGHLERTPVDAGPDKIRRRTTASVRRFSAESPAWTPAQLAAFETFYNGALAGGALAFTATDPFTCTIKTFRFYGHYDVRRSGGNRFVTCELEILP